MSDTHKIEHDGFVGEVIGHYVTREGKKGVVLQQIGTKVVHVYGEKWLDPQPAIGTEPSDREGRALVAKWRELFPGDGWPTLETAKDLLIAARKAKEGGADE